MLADRPTNNRRFNLSTVRFIVISGLIGVGKTTFAKKLAELLGFACVEEPTSSNPYLGDFYQEPEKWAYPMQEFLKSRRFALYQDAFWGIRTGRLKGVVMDRSIHEDTVFAQINAEIGTIDERNWQTYLSGFQDFQCFLPEPDVYVFLDAPPEKCCERTRFRAESGERDEEKKTKFGEDSGEVGIPLDYMRTLHAGYERWLEEIAHRIPTVRLDWDEFQPVEESWDKVIGQLEARSRFTKSLVV